MGEQVDNMWANVSIVVDACWLTTNHLPLILQGVERRLGIWEAVDTSEFRGVVYGLLLKFVMWGGLRCGWWWCLLREVGSGKSAKCNGEVSIIIYRNDMRGGPRERVRENRDDCSEPENDMRVWYRGKYVQVSSFDHTLEEYALKEERNVLPSQGDQETLTPKGNVIGKYGEGLRRQHVKGIDPGGLSQQRKFDGMIISYSETNGSKSKEHLYPW
ncbi:hypothetical protein Tco_0436731 [Tanacetum coccineum]